MAAFTNTSTDVYVDGDLVIRPGETVKVSDDRARQFRTQYAWQFREAGEGGDKDLTEEQIRQETRDVQRPVVPVNREPMVEATTDDTGEARTEEPTTDNTQRDEEPAKETRNRGAKARK